MATFSHRIIETLSLDGDHSAFQIIHQMSLPDFRTFAKCFSMNAPTILWPLQNTFNVLADLKLLYSIHINANIKYTTLILFEFKGKPT